MKINARQLKDVPETLLYTLYMRYRESMRSDARLTDKHYAELVNALDYDFSIFDGIPYISQLSIVCRTILFDTLTRQFMDKCSEGTIISLGSGLDFRFERVDNSKIIWFDIDVPEVIALRKYFFPDTDRRRSIASSVLEISWMDKIPRNKPVFFIAEGLLVYLAPKEVQSFFLNITNKFQASEMILDVYSNWNLNALKCSSTHFFLQKMFGMLKWGIDDWKQLESYAPGIQLVDEYDPRYGLGDHMPLELKIALSDDTHDDTFTEFERDVIKRMSLVGHIKLGDPSEGWGSERSQEIEGPTEWEPERSEEARGLVIYK